MNAIPGRKAAITIAELRSVLERELVSLRELLAVVENESSVVSGDKELLDLESRITTVNRNTILLRALMQIGGDDLQRAKHKLDQSENKLRDIASKVELHDRELEQLSLLDGLLRRRSMKRRADNLDKSRREAIADYEESRSEIELMLASLMNHDCYGEARNIARSMLERHREGQNKKKYLGVRRRILMDDIALYEETDRLLELLDKDKVLEISEARLDRLLRDEDFGQTLLKMVDKDTY